MYGKNQVGFEIYDTGCAVISVRFTERARCTRPRHSTVAHRGARNPPFRHLLSSAHEKQLNLGIPTVQLFSRGLASGPKIPAMRVGDAKVASVSSSRRLTACRSMSAIAAGHISCSPRERKNAARPRGARTSRIQLTSQPSRHWSLAAAGARWRWVKPRVVAALSPIRSVDPSMHRDRASRYPAPSRVGPVTYPGALYE